MGSQATNVRQTVQALQQRLETLQGGDWLGQGATAFYQEMGGQVLPTLKRLAAALESGQQITLQMSQLMAQAEADAARVLRGDGRAPAGASAFVGVSTAASGAVGGPAAPAAPAPGSGSGAPSAGSSARSPAGPATAQAIAASIGQALESMDKVSQALGMGDQLAAAGAAGVVAGLAGSSPAVRDAVFKALESGASPPVKAAVIQAVENDAVDRNMTDFSPRVRELVKQSPTVRHDVFMAEQNGFKIFGLADTQQFVTDNEHHNLFVGTQGLSDEAVVRHMAHEASHPANDPPTVEPTSTIARQDYINQNVPIKLHNEAQAEFNAVQARAEISAAGGPDIGRNKPASNDPYQSLYNDYVAGRITKNQALNQMATAMAGENPSARPGGTYRQMYETQFGSRWDTKHASH
jgi:WXG100 family type VII secretion target